MLEAEAALTQFNEQWKLVDTTAQKTEMISLHARILAQVTDERASLERAQADYATYAKLLETKSPEMREMAEIRANTNCQSLGTQISNDTIALSRPSCSTTRETTDSVLRMRASMDTLNKELDEKILGIMQSVVLGKKITVDQLTAGLAEHEKLLTDIRDRLELLVSKSGTNDRLSVDLDPACATSIKVVSRRQKQNAFEKVLGGTGNVDVLVANHGVAPNKAYFRRRSCCACHRRAPDRAARRVPARSSSPTSSTSRSRRLTRSSARSRRPVARHRSRSSSKHRLSALLGRDATVPAEARDDRTRRHRGAPGAAAPPLRH